MFPEFRSNHGFFHSPAELWNKMNWNKFLPTLWYVASSQRQMFFALFVLRETCSNILAASVVCIFCYQIIQ